ncbi:DNA-processing protein DprA [Butyrivibrio sp. MC2013]|uniref:DNA-processing protein DprA n=1 Tax=Butyrivibrio sp. MC2013 TaxID=1280686 RepID=UPI0004181E66|nr:DNA-processing protein DprA [Butyrivibrio sp. MC2013]
MTVKEEICFHMLASIEGFGKRTLFKLYDRYGDIEEISRLGEDVLKNYMSAGALGNFISKRKCFDAAESYKEMRKKGIRIIPFISDEFPSKLRNIPDPPASLYLLGELPLESYPSVAIIGARMCSEYGRFAAREFGMGLAESGIQIISGMAMGVDGISQKAALSVSGRSFAVLGCGVDICYPADNRELYEELKKGGGIISEYPPGTMPQRGFFPVRNRIISGLSDAVLVVEARKKSGTLITVDMALEQGREIFAVPGRITDRISDGCNDLIRQGAGIATCVNDIKESFFTGLDGDKKDDSAQKVRTNEASSPAIHLTDMEKAVLSVMDIYPMSSSQILEKLSLSGINCKASELLPLLTMMQLKGYISPQGSYYIK